MVVGKVYVNRPVADVFDFVSDIRNEVEWRAGTLAVELSSGEPIGEGTAGASTVVFMRRTIDVEWRFAEFEPHVHFARVITAGPRAGIERCRFVPFATLGTTVSFEIEVAGSGIMGVLSPALRPGLKRELDGDLRRLKSMLESP